MLFYIKKYLSFFILISLFFVTGCGFSTMGDTIRSIASVPVKIIKYPGKVYGKVVGKNEEATTENTSTQYGSRRRPIENPNDARLQNSQPNPYTEVSGYGMVPNPDYNSSMGMGSNMGGMQSYGGQGLSYQNYGGEMVGGYPNNYGDGMMLPSGAQASGYPDFGSSYSQSPMGGQMPSMGGGYSGSYNTGGIVPMMDNIADDYQQMYNGEKSLNPFMMGN